jgi:UDP-4-amino-4,6-dideoxy-N-acetyl-beta-L-altrosamine N-acetyltransferase
MDERDLSITREWRNHPKVNEYMFTQHKITEQEHKNWFEKNQKNELCKLYIYEAHDSALGFVQFQQRTPGSGVWEWGFYICPDAEKGTGAKMTSMALEQLFDDLEVCKIYAEVLAFNIPSIRLHERLGFRLEGILRQQHLLKQTHHDIHCYGMLRVEWLNNIQHRDS